MTLSHCWGGSISFCLRLENLTILQAGIDLAQLPRTFRDAVEVSRRLNVNYLWIDSLCIIQDSADDWYHESSLMNRVYEGAWCCIAATWAENSSDGLFSDRTLPFRPLHAIRLETSWLRDVSGQCLLSEHGAFQENVERSTLLSRGWVVQEQVLSPRIVHFAQGQVFWECESSREGEFCPSFVFQKPHSRPTHKPSLGLPSNISSQERIWRDVVTTYSRTALTKPDKDKTLAIAGLARRLCPPEDYWAGLWKTKIHTHLCWYVWNGGATRLASGAPTWSWMSLTGAVRFPTYEKDLDLCRILGAEVPLITGDSFGAIRGGAEMSIEAPLFWIPCDSDSFHRIDVESCCLDVLFFMDTEDAKEEQLLCMFVLSNKESELQGIILGRSEQQGVFYRRGVFQILENDEKASEEAEDDEEHPRKMWCELFETLSRLGDEIDTTGWLGEPSGREETYDLPLYRITLV